MVLLAAEELGAGGTWPTPLCHTAGGWAAESRLDEQEGLLATSGAQTSSPTRAAGRSFACVSVSRGQTDKTPGSSPGRGGAGGPWDGSGVRGPSVGLDRGWGRRHRALPAALSALPGDGCFCRAGGSGGGNAWLPDNPNVAEMPYASGFGPPECPASPVF